MFLIFLLLFNVLSIAPMLARKRPIIYWLTSIWHVLAQSVTPWWSRRHDRLFVVLQFVWYVSFIPRPLWREWLFVVWQFVWYVSFVQALPNLHPSDSGSHISKHISKSIFDVLVQYEWSVTHYRLAFLHSVKVHFPPFYTFQKLWSLFGLFFPRFFSLLLLPRLRRRSLLIRFITWTWFFAFTRWRFTAATLFIF